MSIPPETVQKFELEDQSVDADTPAIDPEADAAVSHDPPPALDGLIMSCPNCQGTVRETWAFCEWCSNPLSSDENQSPPVSEVRGEAATAMPAAPLDSPGTAAPATLRWLSVLKPPGRPLRRGRWWRPSRRVLLAFVMALLATGTIAKGVVIHRTTEADLRATQHTLTGTRIELNGTNTKLKDTTASLAKVRARLDTETTKRKGLETELAGVKGTLVDADKKLNVQARRIDVLKTCLNGVSTALSAAAREDYGAAIAALDAVDISCHQAYKLL
jgi:hypothetical protein